MIRKLIPQIVMIYMLLPICAKAQNKKEVNDLASSPAKSTEFAVEYKMMLPSLNPSEWDDGYNFFQQFINKSVQKTQLGIAYKIDDVEYWVISPSAKPHAQLDTSTTIHDPSLITGNWRAVSYRMLQFWDSASILSNKIFRTNKQISTNEEDAIMIADENEIKIYVKGKGKSNFKRKWKSKYSIENGRYLLLFKLLKSGAGVSLIGMDSEGRLILNFATVMETKIPGNYINYYANIEQLIFEKI